MNTKKRIIVLSVIGGLLILALALSIAFAFMKPVTPSVSETEVELNSCAKITLMESSNSIGLSNTAPMSDNKGLKTTPYEFKVVSNCEVNVEYNIYLGILSSNTLDASNIKYAILDSDNTTVDSGIVTSKTNGTSDFNTEELDQINRSVGSTSGIYTIMSNILISKTEQNYKLYLWVDSNSSNDVMNKSFSAAVLAKAGEEVESTLGNVCKGQHMGMCFEENYELDSSILLHDSSLANSANDGSYRYAGSSASVNNYVCFGSNEETCPEDNLYRIIGVFYSSIKLIKSDYATSTLLGTDGDYQGTYAVTGWDTSYYKGTSNLASIGTYSWNDVEIGINTWGESKLNTVNLNTNYINNIGSEWANKIIETIWEVGGVTWENIYGVPVAITYQNEIVSPAEATTVIAKIGLMYVSDYGYAASQENWTTDMGFLNTDTNRNNNWMYMGLTEWTISRNLDTSRSALTADYSGYIGNLNVTGDIGVRPCFSLDYDVVLKSGNGTAASPYRI